MRALCQKEFIGRGGRADGAGAASKTVRDTRGEVLLTSSQVSDAIVFVPHVACGQQEHPFAPVPRQALCAVRTLTS